MGGLAIVNGTGFNTHLGLAQGYVQVGVRVQHLEPSPNPYL
jgi:hypothetical protein